MNDSGKWDRLLRQALASAVEPDVELNERIIHQLKERDRMKRVHRKKFSAAILAAVFMLVMSVTAFAATQLFSSKQVAEHLGQQILAKAFESSDAIEINQSAAAGDYNFTLHGIVSGAGLKGLDASASDISAERTYAVVSIARQDGSPMPPTSDPEYGKEPFFVSPLFKGLKPWQVNIVTMNGGYSEVVLDGIMYRLIECDGIEMFADRGVYLAISSGGVFYDNNAFAYNESTGEVGARTDYKGASLLFDLPLDKAKADRAKAEAYLQELLKEPSKKPSQEQSVDTPAGLTALDEAAEAANKFEEIANGTVIPESVKEAALDKQGNFHYEHDGWAVTLPVTELFTEGQTGYSDTAYFSSDGQNKTALQFSRDKHGVITGRIVKLN